MSNTHHTAARENHDAGPIDGRAARPVDVVTAPDFTGRLGHVQEAQALMFLAAWLDGPASESGHVLHLACIGQPSWAVRQLAAKAQAKISVHEPVGIRPGHFLGNKLRGLEVEPDCDHVLLLDADALVFSDLGRLSQFNGCVAAAPDDCPRVTHAQWRRTYDGLNMSPPADRIPCTLTALDLPRYPSRLQRCRVPAGELRDAWPYYNGGVVFAPWASGLRQLWEHNIRRIASLFDEQERDVRPLRASDQAALAVTVEMLKHAFPFRLMDDRLHTRWRHLYAGRPPLADIDVLHLTTFLHALPHRPCTPGDLLAGIHYYLNTKLRRRFGRLLIGDLLRGRLWQGWRRFFGGLARGKAVERRLIQAWSRQLKPVQEVRRHTVLTADAETQPAPSRRAA